MTMTIREALNIGIQYLRQSENTNPVKEANILMSFVLQRDMVHIYAYGESQLTTCDFELYDTLVKKRALGYPLQYILGSQTFMTLDFKLSTNVLIPRHDTEILVETVIDFAKQHSSTQTVNILDIGTGSGCIAVSLAHHIKNCHVYAADISQDALKTAQINANNADLENKITFVKSNIFSEFYQHSQFAKMFDVIVSNPPYIPSQDIKDLQVEVREYEPWLALDGGTDGLDFYRTITKNAPDFMKHGGLLAFEVGYNQAAEVQTMMSGLYQDIKVIKDLSGINRVVTGILS